MSRNPSDRPQEYEPRSQEPGTESRAAEVARIFREHNRKLVGLLVTRLKDEQEAKEIAQEAYVKVLQLEPRPGTVSYLRSYLFRVAENLAVDRLRQRQIRGRIDQLDSMDDLFEDAPAERAAIAEQELAFLKRVVAELPGKCGEAFRLHKLADLPFDKVAALMGLKERMVRRHVSRALVYICLRCEGLPAAEAWDRVMS